MSAPASRRAGAGSAAWLVAIVVVSLNLRIGIVGVGPIIEDIRDDTGMSSAIAGMLGTIPFLCMAVFSLVGFPILRAGGPNRLIGFSLVLIAAGTLARAAAPGALPIVAATIPIGVGIALIGLALPGVVKERFPFRPGAATGAYVCALSIGAAGAAVAVVPLADALGGWRWAFAATALPALAAVPIWARVSGSTPWLRRRSRAEADGPDWPRLTLSAIALRLAIIFGCQGICFSVVVSWVGTLYRDEGWSTGAAALAVAVVPLLTIPAALIAPGATDARDRRPLMIAMAALMCAGMAGLAFAPTAGAWVWLTAVGIGSGALFPLALTLPLDLGRSQGEVIELTAWTLGLGYVVSALGPVLVGALRDASGGFTLPMAIVGIIGLGSGIATLTPALRPSARAR